MEILAPCGSPEHIKAAVYAGADAVYLGGRGFSARRNAVNFSVGEIREAARFCRGFGVKLYVTVNILTRDAEWGDLRAYLIEIASATPDALIVQDVGVARLCRELLPDMPLHASTQMSVHSPEGVSFCKSMGFSRVVIARECGKETLSDIIGKSKIGIEMFVHGALCVSVSGQCGLSAVIGGRSGNRGLCAQPCRLDFKGGGHDYALSLKDLSLVREIPLLEKMGVCALKIEGRMKRPEYVAAAVHACRASLAGEDAPLDDLRAVFSRGGFTQGYFYEKHAGMGGIRTREDVSETAAILPKLAELTRAPSRRTPVDLSFTMERGRECRLTMTDGNDEVTSTGPIPQEAVSRETGADDAERLLSRLGDTPFAARTAHTRVDTGLFMSASDINAMRRDACEKLLERVVERLTPRYAVNPEPVEMPKPRGVHSNTPFLRVQCRTFEQARAVADGAEQVALPIDEALTALEQGFPRDKLIVIPERYIIDEDVLRNKLKILREKGAESLLCQNPAHAVLGRAAGYMLHGGLGLNVFNSVSIEFWRNYGLCDVTASMELKLAEALSLNGGIPCGIAAYGRLPLMLLRRCPFGRDCEKGGKCPRFLTDKTNRRFPIDCHCGFQELLNADTLWMADKLRDLRMAPFLALLLYDESADDAAKILRAYREGGVPPENHTRGLLTRGVE